MRIKLLATFTLLSIFFSSFALTGKTTFEAPIFDNLGSIDFPITTKNPDAKRFFEQGQILYYGFEWGEAIRSFKEATRLDPQCAMCYWGLALALASKMNAPMSGKEYQEAREAIQKANSLTNSITPSERAYIEALVLRFKHPPKKMDSEPKESTFSCHGSSNSFDKSSPEEIQAYAQAMERLVNNYPKDNHAKALYAWTLFDTISWTFWNVNGEINPLTPKIVSLLEDVLKKEPLHIGANHYYIHVIETSPKPGDALESANRLRILVPGSEHLVHMPTHIYLLTGHYHEGTESNLQAVAAFNAYNKTCLEQGFKPEVNYLYFHNYDFLRTTATMEGRKNVALTASESMLNDPFPTWLTNESSLQWFIPIPYFVKARFGMWQELLNETKPKAEYQYAQGMWHYAQGMAFSHLNQQDKAAHELIQLNSIITQGPNDKNLQENGIKLLKIARAVLQANIANAKQEEKSTLSYLRMAMEIQQHMGYHEPPDWYFPVKEMLADAYLKWGHPKEAIQLYQEDLKQYPQNGWALWGLMKSYEKLGNKDLVKQTQEQFQEAWKYAEIPTPISLLNN